MPSLTGTNWERVVTDVVTNGAVAAPTLFSAQRAASHLSRWAPLNMVTVAWGERQAPGLGLRLEFGLGAGANRGCGVC